jgi:CMP-N-acetylneuraminic acid synthetase
MIVFIPIKEISQRVPNKNFRLVDGIPLYKRCLYKLKDYKVYVDTDSERIFNEISKDNKLNHVTVLPRKKELMGHEISVCDIIACFIRRCKIVDQTICQVHVTSPFLKTDTLTKAISMLANYDSVVACNEYQNRLWRSENYGYTPVNHNPLKLEQTQDLPIYYEENSLFYIFNSEYFIKTRCRVGTNPYFYVCNYPENIDIDVEDDWKLVGLLTKGKL